MQRPPNPESMLYASSQKKPCYFPASLLRKNLELLLLDEDEVELHLSEHHKTDLCPGATAEWCCLISTICRNVRSFWQKKGSSIWELLPLHKLNIWEVLFRSGWEIWYQFSSCLPLSNRGFPESCDIHTNCINNRCAFIHHQVCIISHCWFYCEASLITCILQKQHNWRVKEFHHWVCKWFAFCAYCDSSAE